MADQAKYFGCSVSYISAVERGEREIPPEFPDQFIRWLQLTDEENRKQLADDENYQPLTALEISQLRTLARQKKKLSVVVTPADREREVVAEKFSRTINKISSDRLQQMRRLLDEADTSSGYSLNDLSKIAACARACFEVGNQLTFDLIDILENRLPEIDPAFLLEVRPNHNLQSQIAGYAEAYKSAVKKVVLSEFVYESAHSQKTDARFIAAHELGHWLLNQEGNFQTYPSALQLEKDINRFARDFLMPKHIALRYSSPGQLAMICNVPIEQARIRLSELGVWPTREERDKVSKGFSKLLSTLQAEPPTEDSPAKITPDFQLIPFPRAHRKQVARTTPRKRARKNTDTSLPLFEFAESNDIQTRPDYYAMLDALATYSGVRESKRPSIAPVHVESQRPTVDRSVEWFRQFGWR